MLQTMNFAVSYRLIYCEKNFCVIEKISYRDSELY